MASTNWIPSGRTATVTAMTAGSEILQPIDTRSATVSNAFISDTKVAVLPGGSITATAVQASLATMASQTDAFDFSNRLLGGSGFCGAAMATIHQSIALCKTDASCQCQETLLKRIRAVALTCLPEVTATQLQTLLIQVAQYDASCGTESAGVAIGCQQSMIRLHNPKSECLQAATTYNGTLQCVCEQPFVDGYIALHKSCKIENSNRTLSTSAFNLQKMCFSNANVSLKIPRGMIAKSETQTQTLSATVTISPDLESKTTAFGNAVSASMQESGVIIMNASLVGLFVAAAFALLL
ncbi:hypothetical protein BJ741DRAFT_592624 [Chytriomyces cf. hyalinus JEL632]|nr:hypothetical protein BJ741DRAFT_592624 [Chytriomyces cf. hyalinus JEL632]